jgi:hypothetical protein
MEVNKTAGLVSLETLMQADGNTDLFGAKKIDEPTGKSAEELMKESAEKIKSSLITNNTDPTNGDGEGDKNVDPADLLKTGKTDSEKQTLITKRGELRGGPALTQRDKSAILLISGQLNVAIAIRRLTRSA